MFQAYDFNPVKLRAVLAQIAQRFPLTEGKRDMLLDQLLREIAQMRRHQLKPWSQNLNDRERDTLARGYGGVSNLGLLSSVALVLGHCGDERFAEVLRNFFFQLPEPSLVEEVCSHINQDPQLTQRTYTAGWLGSYIRSGQRPGLAKFALQAALAGKVPWLELVGPHSRNTPLYAALLRFLFLRQPRLMAKIPAESAASMAEEAYRSGMDSAVAAYFNHFPDEGLRHELIVRVFQDKGALDPVCTPFFSQISIGRLWILRAIVFEPMINQCGLNFRLRQFWLEWVHRICDWRQDAFGIHVRIPPLCLRDAWEETEVFRLDSPQTVLERIPKDHDWQKAMTRLLADYPNPEKLGLD